MPVGFWENFFDNDYRQREDINELRSELAAATDTSQLARAAGTMTRQIQDLSVLVQVLIRMLEESGHLDGKTLRYRVEAELENMKAAREAMGPMSMRDALAAGRGSGNEPVEAPPPTTPTMCTRCGQTVPQNMTTITAAGVICDRCAVK